MHWEVIFFFGKGKFHLYTKFPIFESDINNRNGREKPINKNGGNKQTIVFPAYGCPGLPKHCTTHTSKSDHSY